jgi:hypothetical protein
MIIARRRKKEYPGHDTLQATGHNYVVGAWLAAVERLKKKWRAAETVLPEMHWPTGGCYITTDADDCSPPRSLPVGKTRLRFFGNDHESRRVDDAAPLYDRETHSWPANRRDTTMAVTTARHGQRRCGKYYSFPHWSLAGVEAMLLCETKRVRSCRPSCWGRGDDDPWGTNNNIL